MCALIPMFLTLLKSLITYHPLPTKQELVTALEQSDIVQWRRNFCVNVKSRGYYIAVRSLLCLTGLRHSQKRTEQMNNSCACFSKHYPAANAKTEGGGYGTLILLY